MKSLENVGEIYETAENPVKSDKFDKKFANILHNRSVLGIFYRATVKWRLIAKQAVSNISRFKN